MYLIKMRKSTLVRLAVIPVEALGLSEENLQIFPFALTRVCDYFLWKKSDKHFDALYPARRTAIDWPGWPRPVPGPAPRQRSGGPPPAPPT